MFITSNPVHLIYICCVVIFAEKVLQCLETRGALNRVIVEANPGGGVLTSLLLKAGAVDVKVLEYRSKWKQKMQVI